MSRNKTEETKETNVPTDLPCKGIDVLDRLDEVLANGNTQQNESSQEGISTVHISMKHCIRAGEHKDAQRHATQMAQLILGQQAPKDKVIELAEDLYYEANDEHTESLANRGAHRVDSYGEALVTAPYYRFRTKGGPNKMSAALDGFGRVTFWGAVGYGAYRLVEYLMEDAVEAVVETIVD